MSYIYVCMVLVAISANRNMNINTCVERLIQEHDKIGPMQDEYNSFESKTDSAIV